MTTPRIAITPGEPAGIGPDLTVMLAQGRYAAELVAIADPAVLAARAKALGLDLALREVGAVERGGPSAPGELKVLPVPAAAAVRPGHTDPDNGRYVLQTLEHAALGCLGGEFDAMVTGPVHKGVINEAGMGFSGHTEYLAELTGAEQAVMMLATQGLRVALVTTHLPLRDVPAAITAPRLAAVVRVLDRDLKRWFGAEAPRILVCGLNPHAGEGGHLGTEDRDIIEPTLERLRGEGLQLMGPLPADTLFTPKYLDRADAVLAMYHDQGLPVLKYAGFGNAINVTLGLPIIRTSVDHGTALDLAAGGKADPGSLHLAVKTALDMVRRRR